MGRVATLIVGLLTEDRFHLWEFADVVARELRLPPDAARSISRTAFHALLDAGLWNSLLATTPRNRNPPRMRHPLPSAVGVGPHPMRLSAHKLRHEGDSPSPSHECKTGGRKL